MTDRCSSNLYFTCRIRAEHLVGRESGQLNVEQSSEQSQNVHQVC